jgi:hypothetical protein
MASQKIILADVKVARAALKTATLAFKKATNKAQRLFVRVEKLEYKLQIVVESDTVHKNAGQKNAVLKSKEILEKAKIDLTWAEEDADLAERTVEEKTVELELASLEAKKIKYLFQKAKVEFKKRTCLRARIKKERTRRVVMALKGNELALKTIRHLFTDGSRGRGCESVYIKPIKIPEPNADAIRSN